MAVNFEVDRPSFKTKRFSAGGWLLSSSLLLGYPIAMFDDDEARNLVRRRNKEENFIQKYTRHKRKRKRNKKIDLLQ